VGGFRRTVVFAHLCMLGFVLMLAWIVVVDGRPLPLRPTLAKTALFYMGGWYMALCSLPVERRRRSTSAAVRRARQLITRLRFATDALEKARLQAEAASEAKGQFLATMSHEVRTPMSAVIGMAELLKDTELDGTQQEYLGHLREGADTTLRLMQDVLDVADLDRSSVDLESVAFAPGAVLRGVVREYRPTAEAKGIELVAEAGEGLPNALLGDRRRTRQLLRLLVDNAVKFTDEGRVVVSCELRSGEASGPRLRWTVCDTGIGFEAKELPRLLETFVQADASDTRRFGGAGLGLALARRLAEAMEGVLEATSTPGGGSTFWVEHPIRLEA